MSALDLFASFLLTLALHATVLLGAVWLAERAGALRHTAWAELAWRTALFGALLSASLEFVAMPGWQLPPRLFAVQASTAPPALGEVARFMPATAPVPAADVPVEPAVAALPETPAAPAAVAATGPAAAEVTPAASTPGSAVTLPDVAAVGGLGLWLLAMLAGALQLGRQAWALRRLGRAVRTHGVAAGPSLARQSARLAGEFGIAPPELRVSATAISPMVLPGAGVLLPAWAEALEPRQQRALLAHELSHLQRRDPAWRIAQRLALLPLAFHPLAWQARRRLEALAEDACDARAAQLMGSGLPLAECLAACLSHAGPRAGHPHLAVAMAGDAGPVLRRVRKLLEDSPMSLRPLSPAMRRTALVVALAAVVALPGLAVNTFASEVLANGISHLAIGGQDSYRYRHSDNGDSLEVNLRGQVRFNAAETDVSHLGKGARLEVVEDRDGVEREILYYGKDGVIQRRYRVDGDERPLDAEGRAWLAKIMPGLLRETAINADARGKAILAKGGPDALLADIARIRTDYAAARYLGVLFGNAKLDAAQLSRALAIAKGIESDFELRQALLAALKSQTLAPAQQVQVLKLSTEIGSDFEQAELLVAAVDRAAPRGEVLAAWRAAADEVGSDFEKRRVIEALLRHASQDSAVVVMALDSAHNIGSDFETREVLTRAAPHVTTAPARQAYLRLAATIGSDFEMREALNALLGKGEVDAATAGAVLDALAGIGSDFEAGEVLKNLAEAMPADPALIERYRAAARRLGDYERGQAEKALDRFASVD